MNYYVTVDKGRTYIAFEAAYIDNVNTYNNFFTQFFMKLIGKAENIYVGSHTICMNKKSYQHLLNRHHITDSDYDFQLTNGTGKMRDVLSKNTRNRLARKLAEAIHNFDTVTAVRMMGKGAALDNLYYDRGNAISFSGFKRDLPKTQSVDITVRHGTPLIHALATNQMDIFNRLNWFGANQAVSGAEYRFKREILKVKNKVELDVHPELRVNRRGRVKRDVAIDIRNLQIIKVQDTTQKINSLVIENFYLNRYQVTDPAEVIVRRFIM